MAGTGPAPGRSRMWWNEPSRAHPTLRSALASGDPWPFRRPRGRRHRTATDPARDRSVTTALGWPLSNRSRRQRDQAAAGQHHRSSTTSPRGHHQLTDRDGQRRQHHVVAKTGPGAVRHLPCSAKFDITPLLPPRIAPRDQHQDQGNHRRTRRQVGPGVGGHRQRQAGSSQDRLPTPGASGSAPPAHRPTHARAGRCDCTHPVHSASNGNTVSTPLPSPTADFTVTMASTRGRCRCSERLAERCPVCCTGCPVASACNAADRRGHQRGEHQTDRADPEAAYGPTAALSTPPSDAPTTSSCPTERPPRYPRQLLGVQHVWQGRLGRW